jgi:hypothetical protein
MHCGRILHSWVVLVIVASAGAYFGSYLLADGERFDVARGDRFEYPHNHYMQLLVVRDDGVVQRLAYSSLAKLRARQAQVSLQIPAAAEIVDLNTPRENARLDYTVTHDSDGLVVETWYEDGEWFITSRYRVDGESVTPLYCYSWNHLLIAEALLYVGLPLALAFWLLGRLLQKHEERVLLARGERPYLQHRYRLT